MYVSQVVIIQLTQLYVYFEPDNDILGSLTFPLNMVQRLQPTFLLPRVRGPMFTPGRVPVNVHGILTSFPGPPEFDSPPLPSTFKYLQPGFKTQRQYATFSLVFI